MSLEEAKDLTKRAKLKSTRYQDHNGALVSKEDATHVRLTFRDYKDVVTEVTITADEFKSMKVFALFPGELAEVDHE